MDTVERTLYAGIDPGNSGALTVMNPAGLILNRYKFDDTETDLAYAFALYGPMIRMCYIEMVRAMPTDRPKSAFSFGRSAGFLFGMLTAYKVPFEEVRPLKWMSFMNCMTGGDKNVTKQRAQQLWPDLKWTHAYADSALIAECCRRTFERSSNRDTRGRNNLTTDIPIPHDPTEFGPEAQTPETESGKSIREWGEEH